MDAESYSAGATLAGDVPVATVAVVDGEGNPVAGAEVRVVFLRQVRFVGYVSNETVMAQTGEDGIATVSAGQLSSLPGDYFVIGYALGTVGSDRYAVGA